MSFIERSVATPFAIAAGWAILNSLWQGTAAAAVLACLLALTRSARLRYAAAAAAIAAIAIAFAWTLLSGMEPGPSAPLAPRAATAAVSLAARAEQPVAASGSRFDAAVPWLALLWISGVWIFFLRSIAAWISAQRLRRRGVCCPPAYWQTKLSSLRKRLRIARPVALLECCFAETPVVLGHFRPVILLPIGLVAGLTADQVEAILLHELAHVRRWDYLVNLVETLVAGILFYHPAIWWISRVIAEERENCCDDKAVAAGADAREYAFALAALEQNRHAGLRPAVAATGGDLMKRIRRLLNPAPPTSRRSSIAAALAALAILCFAMVAQQNAARAQMPNASSAWNRWLNEDVVYIITAQDRAAFLKLATDAEREQFIVAFWARRDPTPGTAQNEFKIEHYRRIAFANQHFRASSGMAGWQTDRGHIYIVFGPPDELESHPASGQTYASQVWMYRHVEGVGNRATITFIDPAGAGDFRIAPGPMPDGLPRQ